ncbi:hypothetical protein ACIHDR_46615 [Nocardia sp. NPDC052278]|uniref:hypothetical protein n=1 Tax=unclassified Nocardia TaxID=2637762 RepID=UPI00369C3A5B
MSVDARFIEQDGFLAVGAAGDERQIRGRYLCPLLVEVLFERICRKNGIEQCRTKPR